MPASENEIESGENPVSPVSHRDTAYPSAIYICMCMHTRVSVCVCLDMPGRGEQTDLCCLIMANINLMPSRTAASSVPRVPNALETVPLPLIRDYFTTTNT